MRPPTGRSKRDNTKRDKQSRRDWSDDDMEGALSELAAQFSINAKGSKSKKECKSIRNVAKSWGVPRSTLQRYFLTPGFFESGVTSGGVVPVLTKDDEATIVKTILEHNVKGMSLNHAQVISLSCS